MVTAIRWWAALCVLGLAVSVSLADEDKEKKEKGEDEAKEHAEAKKVLMAAKTDIASAVKAALQKFPDGKAFRAETEMEDEKPIFEVHVLVGDKIKEVEVDAVSGKVLKAEDDKDEDADEAKEAKEALGKTKTTLLAAIEATLKNKKEAKIFEAEIEEEEGEKVEIEVEYFDGDKVMEAKIDPDSGKVLKVEEEKEDDKEK